MTRTKAYAGQSINPTTVVDSTIGIADTSKTLYGLAIGQRYYFRLKALDTLGLVSSYTIGGLIHILLVLAVVVLVIRVIQGRRL